GVEPGGGGPAEAGSGGVRAGRGPLPVPGRDWRRGRPEVEPDGRRNSEEVGELVLRRFAVDPVAVLVHRVAGTVPDVGSDRQTVVSRRRLGGEDDLIAGVREFVNGGGRGRNRPARERGPRGQRESA